MFTQYLIHKYIFDNNFKEVSEVISSKMLFIFIEFSSSKDLLDKLVNLEDCRGNSPLLLAIMLKKSHPDYLSTIKLLLENMADIKKPNAYDWCSVDEAIFSVNICSN